MPAGSLIRDQIDLYMPPNSVIRKTGESFTQLVLNTFVDNGLVLWPLADGTTVPDFSISAGIVYFNEIPGSPGFYSVRFFPDRTGFWRLIFVEPSLGEQAILSYDVTAAQPGGGPSNDLNATFINQ